MNVFDEFINEMKDLGLSQLPEGLGLGEVISDSPLQIKKNELILEEENLYLADYLKPGYKRKMNYTWRDKDGASGKQIETMTYLDGLKTGDKVVLTPVMSGQKYVVLARVV